MIMRSVHNRMERNIDNPILMVLGLVIFLTMFCIAAVCEKVNDTYKNVLGRVILWRNG